MEQTPSGSRSRRLLICVILGAFFGTLGVLSVIAERYERIFIQTEIRHLPAPSSALLALARFVRSALGFSVLTLVAVASVILVWRGAADARFKPLVAAGVLGWLTLLALFYVSLHVPIVRLHRAMSP